MKKYRIYDTINRSIVCSPIADLAKLSNILERYGISGSDLTFEGTQQVRHLLILPGIDEQPRAPSEIGHTGTLSPWRFDGQRMIRTIEYQQAGFTTTRSQLLALINKDQEKALALLEKGYTEREVKSWPQQRAEAKEYTVDNSKPVPLLKGMAERRGIPLKTFVEHVLSKVKTTADSTAIILGDAQAANDKIKTLTALQRADKLPTDWFDQLMNIADNWRKDWPPELLV